MSSTSGAPRPAKERLADGAQELAHGAVFSLLRPERQVSQRIRSRRLVLGLGLAAVDHFQHVCRSL
jgi:hypothetical protein